MYNIKYINNKVIFLCLTVNFVCLMNSKPFSRWINRSTKMLICGHGKYANGEQMLHLNAYQIHTELYSLSLQ